MSAPSDSVGPSDSVDPMDAPAPELLHILLLTYNRENSFRRTLGYLAASPLKDHRLTIMDNCSTDGTPRVCEEFRNLLPRMEIRRHPVNIGFGANFLRAIELSQGEYTWVLCDDDTLFPERVAPLIDMLRNHRPEACFIGGPRQDEWPSGLNIRPSDIQRRFHTFLTAQSFVPTLIFKTALVGSRELVEGYFSIRTNFPQLVLGRKLLTEDIPCAVLNPPLLKRDDPAEKGTNQLSIIAGWAVFCRTLPPALRSDAFYSVFGRQNLHGMLRELLRMIAWSKIDGGSEPGYHLATISLNAGIPARAGLVICRLACLIPADLFKIARKIYRKVKYDWLGIPLPPNFHAPIAQDELRR